MKHLKLAIIFDLGVWAVFIMLLIASVGAWAWPDAIAYFLAYHILPIDYN